MNIRIKSCIQGAKKAEGIAVIIDVLRASSTITAVLANGAEFVVPLETVDEALKTKKEHPEWILASDQSLLRGMGYYDNSPTILSKTNLKGKGIILITTNGTKGIVSARNAEEVLVGSFLNAESIIIYLKNSENRKITLVPMGEAGEKSAEDELCASYMKDRLNDKNIDFSKIRGLVKMSNAAKYLIETNREHDLNFCLKLNCYDIIPKYFSDGKIRVME